MISLRPPPWFLIPPGSSARQVRSVPLLSGRVFLLRTRTYSSTLHQVPPPSFPSPSQLMGHVETGPALSFHSCQVFPFFPYFHTAGGGSFLIFCRAAISEGWVRIGFFPPLPTPKFSLYKRPHNAGSFCDFFPWAILFPPSEVLEAASLFFFFALPNKTGLVVPGFSPPGY